MKCEVLVDWLTFTVKEASVIDVITRLLGMDPDLFADAGYGLMGYNNVKRFGDIAACYDPREGNDFQNMGVCASMSGNGCRTFETVTGLRASEDEATPFLPLFALLASDERCHVSRRGSSLSRHFLIFEMESAEGKIGCEMIDHCLVKPSLMCYNQDSWTNRNLLKESICMERSIYKANYVDLQEILQLQYLSYQSEADLFGSRDIPPLKQTLDEIIKEYNVGIILKMVDNSGNIIGSIRAKENKGTVYVGKLMVHPQYRHNGMEQHF